MIVIVLMLILVARQPEMLPLITMMEMFLPETSLTPNHRHSLPLVKSLLQQALAELRSLWQYTISEIKKCKKKRKKCVRKKEK